MKKMKEMPIEDRPREKLKTLGASFLSNSELLAIIIKTGTKNKPVLEVAVDILLTTTRLNDLHNMTLQSLSSIKGIGEVKALTLLAVLELSKRLYLEEDVHKKVLKNAKEIYDNSRYLFYQKTQEYFYCLYFNQKNELIERKLLFMGTINRSIVHPREIYKEAYLVSASGIVCLHNHPSNDPYPSVEDVKFTDTLRQVGLLQGIPLLDHIIITDDSYYSFYEHQKI